MVTSVPFLIPGIHAGLADVEGVVRLESGELVLDFRTVDGVVGMLKSRVSEVHIPLRHVEALEYKRGIFRGRIRLRVRRLELLASVPGSDGAEVVLRCKRRHKLSASEFANLVTLQLLDRVMGEENAEPAI